MIWGNRKPKEYNRNTPTCFPLISLPTIVLFMQLFNLHFLQIEDENKYLKADLLCLEEE